MRTTLAAEALPDGKNYYRAKIREFTTLDMEPEAIHQLGVAEVGAAARGHARAACTTPASQGDFPAFLQFLRTDPRFYAKTPAGAADACRLDRQGVRRQGGDSTSATCRARASPSSRCPMTWRRSTRPGRGGAGRVSAQHLRPAEPSALQPHGAHAARVGAGSRVPDPHRDGAQGAARTSAASPTSPPTGRAGRSTASSSADEMGMYDTPTIASACSATRSGAPRASWWIPACTPQGWTREQAIDYFRQYTALPEREIGTEIDRYITWPGQALSYYLGERAILEGRAQARKKRSASASTSAPSTTRCSSSARCRCRC